MLRYVGLSIFLMLSVMMLGCGLSMNKTMPEHQFLKSYQLSETYKVSVGESIVQLKNLHTFPAYTPTFEYKAPTPYSSTFGQWGSVCLIAMAETTNNYVDRSNMYNAAYDAAQMITELTLIPGQIWLAEFTVLEDNSLVITNRVWSQFYGINITKDGKAIGWITLNDNRRQKSGTWINTTLFIRKDVVLDEFMAELVYSGLSNGTVRILYREFANNMARPAFCHLKI